MARSLRGKRIAQFAVMALAAGELPAAAAEVLVLRSDGPRAERHYRAGSRHADNAIFQLRPGDSLVVLAAGGTRSWRGPGYFSLAAPARPLVLANGQQVRVQTGALRSPPRQEGVQPTEFWHYDIRAGGDLCVPVGTRPTLWRPRSDAPARATLTAASGVTHSFDWPADQTSLAWPDAVPVRDKERYFLTLNGTPRAVRVEAHVLPQAADASVDQIAAQLVQSGCSAQLDTLIATRVDPSAPIIEAAARGAEAGR